MSNDKDLNIERMHHVQVYRVGRDHLVVTGEPSDDMNVNGDSVHNCDYMGCGHTHVLLRAVIVRAEEDSPAWDRPMEMLRILQDIYDVPGLQAGP